MKKTVYPKILLGIGILALILSALIARDLFTWVLEVTPALLVGLVLIFTYRRFQFSNFIYTLILLHTFVLMYGAIYTYAEAPLGEWMKHFFGFTRNNYDKIGHFAQGFIPVLVMREFMIRKNVLKDKKWLAFLTISITLAFSAVYELLEWWISLLSGEAGDAFLGTQGYIWDTQSDMLLCLIGSIVALCLLSRLHDRSIDKTIAVKS